MESLITFNSSHGWQCLVVHTGNASPWQKGACSSRTSTSFWLAAGSCLPGLHRWQVLMEMSDERIGSRIDSTCCSQAAKSSWQLWSHRAALAVATTRWWRMEFKGRLEGEQRTLGFGGANRGLFRDCLAWSPGELPWRGKVPRTAVLSLKATYWELRNEPSCHVEKLRISEEGLHS